MEGVFQDGMMRWVKMCGTTKGMSRYPEVMCIVLGGGRRVYEVRQSRFASDEATCTPIGA
jgi:hypothetical protein